MKLKIFLTLLAVALFTVACSNDDKQEDVNLSQAVAGVYNGYTSAAFSYSSTPVVTPKETLTLADKGGSKVDVTLVSGVWGTYKLTDVAVTAAGNAYAMAGEGVVSMSMHGNAAKEYPFTMKGTVEAGKKNPSFTVTLQIMGGTTITFAEGNAPAARVVAGTYKGQLRMSVGSTAYDPSDAAVKVSAKDDQTLTVVLPEVGAGAMKLPAVTLSEVKVSTTDYVTYTLAETAINEGIYAGKLSGTIKDNTLSLTYSVKPGAMPMSINFAFTGSK